MYIVGDSSASAAVKFIPQLAWAHFILSPLATLVTKNTFGCATVGIYAVNVTLLIYWSANMATVKRKSYTRCSASAAVEVKTEKTFFITRPRFGVATVRDLFCWYRVC